MKYSFFITLILFLSALEINAQIMPWENRTDADGNPFEKSFDNSSSKLKLEEVVKGSPASGRGIGAINWMKDGERYSRIEPTGSSKAMGLVSYRAKDNHREILIPAEKFINPQTGKQIAISSVNWSDDNNKLLVFTNTRRVWRYHTRGDYWVMDLKNGTFRKLGKGLPEASLMFAKFSPDATKVAYVSQNNIYVENIADGKIHQLTKDGNDKIINGTFDWVYEEEFGCRDGFRWSPSGKYIAFWQSNTDGTGWFDIINNVDSIYSKVEHFPYPKAGTKNSAVKVGYIDIDSLHPTWITLPENSQENYIPRMEFIPGEDVLIIQQMNRQQNRNRVWLSKLDGTPANNIFTDTDAAWLETNDDIIWIDNNKWFTWESERNGWRHLYRISRDGKTIKPITKGNFDYISKAGIDAKNNIVYFIASPDNFTQRYLYSAALKGDGNVKRISPLNQSGQHSYIISPTAQWAVHNFSNASTPPVIDIISLPLHKSVRVLEDNKTAREHFAKLGLRPKEFVKVKSGNLILDGWMIKPIDFDSTKKYPVIVEVYGEPASSTVQDVWGGGYLWNQYMANKGYIVVSIDNRGANTPRGRDWRKCIYGEVGTFASYDQAQGILDLARQFSFIDTNRIGITGWSGGGSQTLNSMFRYPDVFKTGIAIAFVADQKTYDTIYQERYMNTPQENQEGYVKGSPINYVDGLKGNLLLIHGTGDDNVHYQNCEMLINKLVEKGKYFDLMIYPMRTHSINERSGTTMHLRRTMERYWLRNLPAGPR